MDMRRAKVAINRWTREIDRLLNEPESMRDGREKEKEENGNERSRDVPFKPIILCTQTHARAAFHQ